MWWRICNNKIFILILGFINIIDSIVFADFMCQGVPFPLPPPGGGGGGGACLIGACTSSASITFWKSTVNEDEATVPTALWTLHRACAPGYRSQISYLFRGSSADLSGGSVNLIPFFSYFPVFDTLNAIRALRAGGEKDKIFTRFYWRGWCTGPNETCPPPPWTSTKMAGKQLNKYFNTLIIFPSLNSSEP